MKNGNSVVLGTIIFILVCAAGIIFIMEYTNTTSKFGIYKLYYINGRVDKIITKHKLNLQSDGCVWDSQARANVGCYVMKMEAEIDK